MNPRSIVVQQPVARSGQLILLCHGLGANAGDLVPLALRVAQAFPHGTVVSVSAPQPTGYPGGYQWFDIDGITDASRVERIAAAMPGFLGEIRGWQQAVGVTEAATALVGFSQGSMMALESSMLPSPPAARVVGIAGRFARLPEAAPARTTIHLLHGEADPVVPCRHTIDAAQRLRDLGADVTADVFPLLGHGIDDELAERVVDRLRSYVPRHLWDEALGARP
jgi:phospholipase/carboxylesterase